jgi:[acyl-carrier-protein] S-malonyltransferase
MSKTALLFPGQASQYVGMGKDLYESSEKVRSLYEMASDEMGTDLARLSFEGPAEELKRTRVTQPAILVHSLAVLTILEDQEFGFDFAAGHSLGEYGALAAAGSLCFSDTIKAVVKRASLMEDACCRNEGTMAAFMGLDEETVARVCSEASTAGVVVPANYNSDSQIVISGTKAGIEAAVEKGTAAGAKRAILLEVGGAFHSPLMEPARTALGPYLESINVETPAKPVIANVTARPVADGADVKKLLVEQITAPVKWAQTMTWLGDNGVTRTVEVGPGKVLTGLARRAIRLESFINLDSLNDIRAFTAVAAE